jgi:alkylation response protein AidB-like acyl-CoA dehydrogenase
MGEPYLPDLSMFLSEEETAVQEAARQFAQETLVPRAAEIDRTHSVPRELLKRMADLGFMGVLTPAELGGSGLTNACLFLIQVEINRACASTGVTMSVHNSLVTSPLLRFGSDDLKKKYLPRLASAEMIGAYCLSEPGSGSDAGALATAAARRDGGFTISGQKIFVTNGALADLFIVFARTHSDLPKTRGITAFVVERNSPGLSVGKPEKKMGIRGSSTVAVFFEEVRVPASNVLGAEGEGFKVALTTLDGGRIGISAQAIGITLAALEASVKYARERSQFGKLLAEFQAIQWKIAHMATDVEAALLMGLRAARLRDQGRPHSKEASMAKLFSATMANRHASEAVQIHGGVGYLKDFPVERYFRDAKITEIYEGTNEIQRFVIAREVLDLKNLIRR